jgi:hypothetical protein
MFIVVYYVLQKKTDRNLGQALLTTAVLMGFFVPFSYLMDSMMYRAHRKRTDGGAGGTRKKR